MLIKPIRAEADTRELHSLIRAIVLGSVHRVVEENPSTLGPFGLDEPVAAVTIKGAQWKRPSSLAIRSPVLNALCASDLGSCCVVDRSRPKDFVNKSTMTFRRKDMLVMSGEIDRVRLTYPTTEVVLYRITTNPNPNGKSGTP